MYSRFTVDTAKLKGNMESPKGRMVAYRPTRTDHDDSIMTFVLWFAPDHPQKAVERHPLSDYMIQVRRNTNFRNDHIVAYYATSDGGRTFDRKRDSNGYKRMNSYKNFKTSDNYFWEFNMLIQGSDAISEHHKSTIHGKTYARSTTHDPDTVTNKGSHW